jgi:hypothetical protein
VGQTHLSGTTVSLVGGDPGVPVSHTSLARKLQSASGVGSHRGSAVSRTSFFDLSNGDANIFFKSSYHRRIVKVI